MLKPGCIPAVIYYEYPNGHVTLAPFSDAPTPVNAIRREADTLAQVDRLEKRLQEQELQIAETERAYDEHLMEARRLDIRDRLYQRIQSSGISEFERDFLKLYLQLRDERKKEKYRQRWLEMTTWHFYARHNNLGDRDASKEEVNLDKVNF
jgi:hypothetical protein